LAALIVTGYFQLTNKMNWVGNWPLWSALQWSDFGTFQLDRSALVLNRLLLLTASVFFLALAVRFFPRRDWDPVGLATRLRPWPLVRAALGLAAFAAVPLVLGITLYLQVHEGAEGAVAKKERKDYWRQNLNTWKDALLPAITAVDVNVELEPERGWF